MFTIAFHSFTPLSQFSGDQRPDSFSAFIRSVSSTVRLIWDITQIEDISLVHTSNCDYANIKSAT